jgi:hypothetical protein
MDEREKNDRFSEYEEKVWAQCLMPIIPNTWEAEIR